MYGPHFGESSVSQASLERRRDLKRVCAFLKNANIVVLCAYIIICYRQIKCLWNLNA